MIRVEKTLIIVFTLISMFACTNETIPEANNEELNEVIESSSFTDDLDSRIKISPEEMAYMNSLPAYDPEELALALENTSHQSYNHRLTEEVWGIGTGRTVWKWNGASWGQPNPAARLDIVEVAKNGENSVWGIGTGGTVWKWNGASWGQPNPAARLIRIAVHSSTIAFGVARNRTLFVTTNGGQNWAPFTNFQNANWISSGDYFNLLSVTDLSGNLYKYDLFSQQMDPVTIPPNTAFISHATIFGGGIWASEGNFGKVYRSTDCVNFIQPNANLTGVRVISTNVFSKAWAIRSGRTVWKTNNSGSIWFQPNSAARLDYISAAY
ncbi:MAG: hypothetical protein K0U54_01515 [Bacteroidetes bacterium]|nr:hypothetical protein [Bacteroidota bacterium]